MWASFINGARKRGAGTGFGMARSPSLLYRARTDRPWFGTYGAWRDTMLNALWSVYRLRDMGSGYGEGRSSFCLAGETSARGLIGTAVPEVDIPGVLDL